MLIYNLVLMFNAIKYKLTFIRNERDNIFVLEIVPNKYKRAGDGSGRTEAGDRRRKLNIG